MFWKDQPNTPIKGGLRSLWSGGNFYILDNATDTVILEIDSKNDAVNAKLPAGAIDTAEVKDGSITAAKTSITASEELDKTSDGVITLLPASDYARSVILVVQVIETFADGTGAQTVFKIGDETTDDKFILAAELVDETNGKKFFGAGEIAAGEKLIVTADKATGNGEGAIRVTAIATR